MRAVALRQPRFERGDLGYDPAPVVTLRRRPRPRPLSRYAWRPGLGGGFAASGTSAYVFPAEYRYLIDPSRGKGGELPFAFVPPFWGEKTFDADWSELVGTFEEWAAAGSGDPDRIVTHVNFFSQLHDYQAAGTTDYTYADPTVHYSFTTGPLYAMHGYEKIGPGQYRVVPSSVSWQEKYLPAAFGVVFAAVTAGAAAGLIGATSAATEAVADVATVLPAAGEATAEAVAAEFAQSAIPAVLPAAAVPVASGSSSLLAANASAIAKTLGGMAVSKVVSSVVSPAPTAGSSAAQAQANLAAQLQAAQAAQAAQPGNTGLLLAGGLLLLKLLAVI